MNSTIHLYFVPYRWERLSKLAAGRNRAIGLYRGRKGGYSTPVPCPAGAECFACFPGETGMDGVPTDRDTSQQLGMCEKSSVTGNVRWLSKARACQAALPVILEGKVSGALAAVRSQAARGQHIAQIVEHLRVATDKNACAFRIEP